MLKKSAISILAVLAGISSARAADPFGRESLKDAPAAVDRDYNWNRAWGALILGYGMTNTETEIGYNVPGAPTVPLIDGLGAEGVFGEVQIGLDRQFGSFVAGVFAGAGYSDATFGVIGLDAIHQNESYFAGLRGGVLISPSTLAYAAGGWRWTNFSIDDSVGSGDETLDGAFVETGLEGRFNRQVGWKVFGRYTMYGDTDVDADYFKLNMQPDELQFGAGLTVSLGY